MLKGKIHFFIEQRENCAIATHCYNLGSERPNVKEEYKKFVNVGYMPYTDENKLIIIKDTLEELENYLEKNYPDYRCTYYKE